MSDEDTVYLDALEEETKKLRNKNTELMGAVSNSSFNQQKDGNLIQFQLEADDILEKIEHFLKGDKIKENDGEIYYEEQKNKDLIILNEYGVNSVMQILGNYVNKNTNLSYYDEERIYEIMGDLGDELAAFIFCNYEKMGLTTEFKKSRYKLLVINVLHIIESSYRRALQGQALIALNNNNINISQNEGFGNYRRPMIPVKKKFDIFSPKTWR